WGFNIYGQVTVPAGLASVAQISARLFHTCALKTDGTVVCWGLDYYGEASVPAGIASVVQISAGYFHNCALKTDQTVVCWGYNGSGQTAVPAGLVSVAQISAGGNHTCAVKTDGTVVCWGESGQGQATVPAGLNLNVRANQTITFGALSSRTFGDPPFALTASASSNLGVTFSASGTCAVAGSTVSLTGAGGCTITADQPGNASFFAAPSVSQSFAIARAPQVIAFGPLSPRVYGSPSLALSASGGASGNPVVFMSQTVATCTTSNGAVSIVAVGTCTITADQAGSANYLPAAQVTRSFVITPAPQTITITSSPPQPVLLDGSYTITATGGGSGSPIKVSSLTPGVCPVGANNVAAFIAVGACTIALDQAGAPNYLAAPQVTQSFNVLYAFTGFFSPVSNPPTLNVIDVGQSMPMWFSLAGDRGLAVLAAGSPTSQAITCPVGAVTNPISQVEDTGPGLQFKKASGRYVYLWRTDEAWAGTCRVFTLTLVDGTTHQASFKIRQQ
ncbi:MAG TPA: PxKF domain-containing protein, partial [Gemmatimonadaceae bacterium]|nr:PxKF domain-containing protein [Gemmatimonadaceae bacterium]